VLFARSFFGFDIGKLWRSAWFCQQCLEDEWNEGLLVVPGKQVGANEWPEEDVKSRPN
jgi:hypothetical protein